MAGHFPQKHRKKMESDWHLGIWVGRTSNSNEHILLTQEGVLRCRLVRRLELAERYNKKIMENATGLPWDQRPPRDHADGGPLEGREPPRGTLGQSDEQLADRRPGAELAQFHASFGQTTGCQAWLEKKTRISPHGGLQSKAARVARPTGIRRNGNIRDRDHQNQRKSQEPCRRATHILPQRQLEVTQCDDRGGGQISTS